jgi:hypothetical protein
VQIDHHVRIERVQQPHHRSRFRRVELHVVAVDVQPLRVRPRPLAADRPMLEAAAGERHPLVAIGVVDRVDQQDHGVEPVGVRAAREVAHECQRRLFAFHFAGVNVGLDVDPQLPARAHRRRSGVSHPADDRQRQRAPFERVAERGDVDER